MKKRTKMRDQIEQQFSGKKDAETLNRLLEFYRSLPGGAVLFIIGAVCERYVI